MTCHSHACATCDEQYLCSAPLERNDDGWPDPVCVTRMESNPTYQQCEDCNAGRLPCDHCNGAKRGEWSHALGMVVCEDCLSNMGEAQSQMRLEA